MKKKWVITDTNGNYFCKDIFSNDPHNLRTYKLKRNAIKQAKEMANWGGRIFYVKQVLIKLIIDPNDEIIVIDNSK